MHKMGIAAVALSAVLSSGLAAAVPSGFFKVVPER